MDSINKSLENWLNDLNNFSFKSFEQLPDLELYMDQVVTFLEKQLYIFQTSTLDKQITPSMINIMLRVRFYQHLRVRNILRSI